MALALKPCAIRTKESSGPWLHSVAVRVRACACWSCAGGAGEELIPTHGLVDPRAHDPTSSRSVRCWTRN